MKKVKVFRFEVSNWTMKLSEKDLASAFAKKELGNLATEEKIENIINDFIKDKEDVEIKINTIDVDYHNNARCNTIHLIYTIVYTANHESKN